MDLCLKFDVINDHLNKAEVEAVDPASNEIFMSNQKMSEFRGIKMKREIETGLSNSHDWLSISSRIVTQLTSVQRLLMLLAMVFSEMAFNAFLFGDPNSQTSTPAPIKDFFTMVVFSLHDFSEHRFESHSLISLDDQIWTTIFMVPVATIVYSMFARVGHRDIAVRFGSNTFPFSLTLSFYTANTNLYYILLYCKLCLVN